MASQFSREMLKCAVAKVCVTMGWHSTNTTPLEILTDIVQHYMLQLGKSTNDYANEFGMIIPNMDHLGLAFRDYHVNLSELEEYVRNVECVEPPTIIPKYPLPKEDHLNFLKPGSKEVVTRPVHIHEHLPPMHPVLEASENDNDTKAHSEETDDMAGTENLLPIFKRPADISPEGPFKRPRLLMEEEGRPTREISSVMMTTSGFLSPAREGKLPEARTPLVTIETAPVNVPQPPAAEINKKSNKVVKRVDRKKERVGKALFKPLQEDKVKKVTTMKDIIKLKQMMATNTNANPINNVVLSSDVKISPIPSNKLAPTNNKFNKALAAIRQKTEKLNTTITPIPSKATASIPPAQSEVQHVDKLFTEPDKKKINIFKKISNVKNEKLDNKVIKVKDEIKHESRESSPDLIIDESANDVANKIHHLSNDITIELIDTTPPVINSPSKIERSYFDDDSPPGTPSTPKTPEMISQSPPLTKEKRKRKDKSKVKKVPKQQSPAKLDADVIDVDLERPKTPEAHIVMKQEKQEPPAVTPTMPFPFFQSFAGPGLIPAPLNNPLFPHLPIPTLGLPSFGQPPYIPPVHPGMPLNFIQPSKIDDVVSKPVSVEKPPPVINGLDKVSSPKPEKKNKEHKKEKRDKIKKKNKKDKVKNKAEKKKLKEEKKDKEKTKKEKKEKRKDKESREGEISVPKLTLKLGSASPRPETPDTRKLYIKPIVKKEEEVVHVVEPKRELSPELAKISALVTGQPKPKTTNNNVVTTSNDNFPSNSTDSFHTKKSMFKPIPKLRTKEIRKEPVYDDLCNSAPSIYIDSEGNKVWICPACGKQDDGSPMIGCDDCDAWYHWVCVGIQVPPDDNEDWYCRQCISKKQEVLQTDKKKKRKKKEKKEH